MRYAPRFKSEKVKDKKMIAVEDETFSKRKHADRQKTSLTAHQMRFHS